MVHQSWFSYSIKRRYPYKWYTPTTIVGGIIAVVVLSIINLASTGYNSIVIYSPDPNATVAQDWYKGFPLLFDAINPTCQPSEIPLDGHFQTNNSALTYTLGQIARNPVGAGAKSDYAAAPSLIYKFTPLRTCAVSEIQVLFSSIDRTAAQFGLSSWGASVQSRVSCTVALSLPDDAQPARINLTTTYDLVPETVSILTGLYTFNGRNKTAQPSLYWGEVLLANNWGNLTQTLNRQKPFALKTKGTVSFTPSGLTRNVASLDYFAANFRAIDYGGDDVTVILRPDWGDFVIAADSFAKVAEATIMADLGQTDWGVRNILSDPELLQRFFTKGVIGPNGAASNILDGTDGIEADPPVGFGGSVIATTYLCQVPALKGWANLIISLIVADLVFLKVLWALFNFVVSLVQSRHDAEVNFCDGCRNRVHHDRSIILSKDRQAVAVEGSIGGDSIHDSVRYERLNS
ncbi:hypothetical protein F4808DRAFT_465168 [Astrocystis sublimbata]|nr:hypothetical protein F4808DRAFT_465168 [Astrocystis sublimbata]